jgi:hypothetical protein
VRPSTRYQTSEFWEVWPIALAIASPDDVNKSILIFLIQCSPGQLCQLMMQLDLITGLLRDASRRMAILFSEALCGALGNRVALPLGAEQDLFDLSQRLILYQRHPDKLSRIERCLQPGLADDFEFTVEDFLDALYHREFDQPFHFSLSFTDAGEWLHAPFLPICFRVFLHFPALCKKPFYILLAGFALRANYDISPLLDSIPCREMHAGPYATELLIANYYSVMARHCLIFPTDQPYSSPMLNHPLNGGDYLYFAAYAKFKAHFSEFRRQINDITSSLKEGDITEYHRFANKQMREFLERQKLQNEICTKSWQQLWQSLSKELAPWHNAAPAVPSKIVRDRCACFGFAPVKIIPRLAIHLSEWSQRKKRGWLSEHRCKIIDLTMAKEAHLKIFEDCFMISVDSREFSIWYDSVTFLFWRRRFGLHLFTVLGRSFHLELGQESQRSEIIEQIAVRAERRGALIQKVEPKRFITELPYMEQWRIGQISNYEYILLLNTVCGRSFNDLDFYPVFPWVLKNFGSADLDPNNVSNEFLRDFSRCTPEDPLPKVSALTYLQEILPTEDPREVYSMDDCLRFMDDGVELVPEFFSMPELFNRRFVLPKWASSPLEFVYLHRKVLESDRVSSTIHHWFTSIFGPGRSPSLLNEKHPEKSHVDRHSPVKKIVIPRLSRCQIGCVSILEERFSNFLFSFYDKRGTISTVPVQLRMSAPRSVSTMSLNDKMRAAPKGSSSQTGLSQLVSEQAANSTDLHVKPIPNAVYMVSAKRSFLVIDGNSRMHMIDRDQGAEHIADIGPADVTALATDGIWAAIGKQDATILLVRMHHRKPERDMHYTISLFSDAVTAIAVSQMFNIIVAGTAAFSIIFYSTVTCELVRVVNLKEAVGSEILPKGILITPAWGFVIVYGTEIVAGSEKFLVVVYTVNGILVHKTEIQFPIHFWYCWASTRGFDYVAYADDAGRVYYNEVFYLASQESVLIDSVKSPILAMQFSSSLSSLVMVTREGQIHFEPMNLF